MPPQKWAAQQAVPPGIKIQISIPEDKAEVAISKMRELGKDLSLAVAVSKKEPDPLIPNAIYHEILVIANSMPKTSQEAEIINTNIMQFQALLQTSILVANTSQDKLLELARDNDNIHIDSEGKIDG